MSRQHPFQRTDRSRLGLWWWTTDHLLLGATAVLIVLGVILQFGTSPAAAQRIGIAWPFHFAARQCVFAAGGAILLVGASLLDPRGVRRVSVAVWLVSMVAMAFLPFVGHVAKGAGRWVEIAGFTLQPSEFMKPALIVLVARARPRASRSPSASISRLSPSCCWSPMSARPY
jgi:cell division protein FtsW